MRFRARLALLASLLLPFSLGGTCGTGGPYFRPHPPSGAALLASPQSDPIAYDAATGRLFVANTTSNTISVIDTASNTLITARDAGLEPVSLAIRPDGTELWVSAHVSDAVVVFDIDPLSPRLYEIKATIQGLAGGPAGSTTFDEPVGIAFASDSKAYVALSSTNQIAIVDIVGSTYAVRPGRIAISAQEPRAIEVADGKLFVAAFESGNQSELSVCPGGTPSAQCTLTDLNAIGNFATSPNLPGEDKNIVIDPQVPDRDLFVFDTSDELPVSGAPVTGVGTLLYGLAATSSGTVFVSLTDARNAVNGVQGESLADLENRIFLNRVVRIDCGGSSCGSKTTWDLEPLPPSQPAEGDQLATPYGIAVSDDGDVVVATAAASSRLFTLNASNGAVRGRVDVGAIPRGVALRSNPASVPPGAPQTAYVLNTLGNSVSVVDVSDPDNPSATATIPVGADPTPEDVRLGRIAFNDANASSTGTFACASCHPDGNTDQLLWRIGGCFFSGDPPTCDEDESRSTMPIRGLKNTIPLHWDGTLGDPFGGPNGAVGGGGSEPADCSDDPMDPDGDHACFLDLVNASLSGVMCDQTAPAGCPPGGNELTATERENMARFLPSVSYPPARQRRIDDVATVEAVNGFQDFFMDRDGNASPDTCADSDAGCHELPLGAATNSATLDGFDAPTMRGMTDRFLQFSLGITGAEEMLVFANNLPFPLNTIIDDPEPGFEWAPSTVGMSEKATFAAAFLVFQPTYGVRPVDLFQMFEEASTGFSGAVGRQLTLTDASFGAISSQILDALEDAADRGVINLIGNGVKGGTQITVSYHPDTGLYQVGQEDRTRAQLEGEITGGTLRVTLVGKLPPNFAVSTGNAAQPLLGESLQAGITGDPDLPNVTGGDLAITVEATDVLPNAVVFVDGAPWPGSTLTCCGSVGGGGTCSGSASYAPYCTTQQIGITLGSLPAPNGTHLLQIQNEKGPLSNEVPICVGTSAAVCSDPN